MSDYKGTARTVGELRELLADYPDDLPVRLRTLDHEFPPEVHKNERCITLEV